VKKLDRLGRDTADMIQLIKNSTLRSRGPIHRRRDQHRR
jgi:hypothetical protein